MKTLTIICPKCKKPMKWCVEAVTNFRLKIKSTHPEGRALFGCENKKCSEYHEVFGKNTYTFNNKTNFEGK
jgi:hypothetical protein